MSPKKKTPSAYAVLSPSAAPRALAGIGKARLMDKIDSATGDGDEMIAALIRVMRTADKDSDVVRATELLFLYRYGKPTEFHVSVDATGGAAPGAQNLTTAHLMAIAESKAGVEEDAETEPVDSGQPVPKKPAD